MVADEIPKPVSRLRRVMLNIAAWIISFFLIYVGSFVAFRVFCRHVFVKTHMVVFSRNPDMQGLACIFYSPLIKRWPGDDFYPNRKEMLFLNKHSGPSYGDEEESDTEN